MGSDIAAAVSVPAHLMSPRGIIGRLLLPTATGVLAVAAATAVVPARSTVLDVDQIIQKSVAVTHKNWAVATQFDHCERQVTSAGAKTYAVTMILGSPYYRLTAVDDKPLSDDDRQRQQDDEDAARVARAAETSDERARRVEQYERQARRNRLLLEQLPYAFDFSAEGTQAAEGSDAFVIRAMPKPAYRPPNSAAEVLTGMEGRLWIQQQSFQWIKVEATVVHSVSIEAFLARVEPGTRFSLAQRPVTPAIWMPTQFSMRTRARILFFLRQRTDVDETYFDYRRIEPGGLPPDAPRDSAATCPPTTAFN